MTRYVLTLLGVSLGFVLMVVSVVYYASASTNNFYKYGSIEDLSHAIHEKKFADDSINWQKYKAWTPFELADDDLKDCLKHRHDLSSNLADYEIYNCYEEHEQEE
jgi:hypothetical protein